MDSTTGRLIQGCIGAALAVFAAWLAWQNLSLSTLGGLIFWVPITLWLLTMSLLCWWSALSRDRTQSRAAVQSSWRVGWRVGGIGLALGFVGPLLIYPEANLGPLLGILITGPLGFVLGALGAGVGRALRGSQWS
jgi:hypothetical protein